MSLLAFLSFPLMAYGLLVIWMLSQGVRKAKPNDETISLSILIPARNEAERLPKLLNRLKGWEAQCLLIDDQSTDGTASLAKEWGATVIANEGKGKKAALQTGARHATGNTLLMLDADVLLRVNFVEEAQTYMQTHRGDIWLFPVHVHSPQTFVGFFDAIDLLSLIYTTRCFAFGKQAIMGNGACLAVRKDYYAEVTGKLREDIPSGDDTFLVQQAVKDGRRVHFVEDPSLSAEVPPATHWKELLLQRIRWGQKTPAYLSFAAKLAAWIVLLANLSTVISFFAGWFHWMLWAPFAGKLFFDLIFLWSATAEFERKKLRPMLLPTSFLYPFYLVTAAVAGFFFRPKWKA